MPAPPADLQMIDRCRQQFQLWFQKGRISQAELKQILEIMNSELRITAVVRQAGQQAPRLTVREFLIQKLMEFRDQGILAAQTAHELTQELELSGQAKEQPASATDPASGSEKTQTHGASLIERMLNPRSLQAMMISGGGLLVLGLVIWLWTIGLFENRLIVALLLGAANLALITAGVVLVQRTRYLLAGRGLAFLGCLVLPLNLWFYDAQGLITIAEGGQLWIPALICCVIYGLIAKILKDSLFVYALVGGVVMTGLLFLADRQVNRLWEVISPAALLVVLGMICIHLERLFEEQAEAFSRASFGRAFFRAGHLVLAAGLGLLFGGRIVGVFYKPIFADWHWFPVPDVALVKRVQFVALLLACGATYSYTYSYLVVRRSTQFLYAALLTLLWSEVILLDVLSIELTGSILLLLLASTSLLTCLIGWRAQQGWSNHQPSEAEFSLVVIGKAGAGLATLTVVLGVLQFLFVLCVPEIWGVLQEYEWTSIMAMFQVAVACIFTALRVQKNHPERKRIFSLQLTGIPLVIGLLEILLQSGMSLLPALTIGGGILLGILGLCRYDRKHYFSQNMMSVVEAMALLLFILSVGEWTGLWTSAGFTMLTECRALLAGELAIAFLWLGIDGERRVFVNLAGVCSWASIWYLFMMAGVVEYAPLFSASGVGLAGLLVGLEMRHRSKTISVYMQGAGLTTLLLSSMAGTFLTWNRVVGGEAQWQLLGLMALQALTALTGAAGSRTPGFRTGLIFAGAINVLSGLAVINQLSVLSFMQRIELFSLVGGVLLLLAGHLGWRREKEKPNDMVSLNLFLGSLLTTLPLVLGLLDQRMSTVSNQWGWALYHEIGVLVIGLTLLGLGVLLRIRSTTLAGASSLVLYVLSLIMLIHLPDQLQNVAVYMMVGGASFFGIAILLSIYRVHLLSMPDRIRNGEGMFQVLKWR